VTMGERAVWKTKAKGLGVPHLQGAQSLLRWIPYYHANYYGYLRQTTGELHLRIVVLSNQRKVAFPSCMLKPECTSIGARSCEKRVDADERWARRPPAATCILSIRKLSPSHPKHPIQYPKYFPPAAPHARVSIGGPGERDGLGAAET